MSLVLEVVTKFGPRVAAAFVIVAFSSLHAAPYLYVAQSDGSSSIFDIVSPTSPTYQNSAQNLQAFALTLTSNGKLLYGPSSDNGLSQAPWNFTNPDQPVFVQNSPGNNSPWGVLVPQGAPDFWVGNGAVNVFSVYPMFDPTNPDGNGLAPLQNIDFFAIFPNAPYLYTVQNSALKTFDATDPANPILSSSISIDSNHLVMHPTGSNLYVIDSTNLQLSVFDLSSPSSPQLLPMSVATGANPQVGTIIPSGNYLYVVSQDDNSLSIFNIQTPSAPVASPTFTSPNFSQPYSLISSPDGSTLYVSNQGNNSISVLDISSPESPVWIQNISVTQVPTYMTISTPFLYPRSITTNSQ